MPGDLRDPEQYEPWHHDELYNHDIQPLNLPGDVSEVIQAVAWETLGGRIGDKLLEKVQSELAKGGYALHHPGDESLRDQIRNILMARKVASSWLMSKQC